MISKSAGRNLGMGLRVCTETAGKLLENSTLNLVPRVFVLLNSFCPLTVKAMPVEEANPNPNLY